jgi:hypothetical protein
MWVRSCGLVVALLGGLASGCAHASANVAAVTPSLDVPAPPPRAIEATTTDVPQTVGSPEGVPPSGIDELNRALPPRAPRATAPRADLPRTVEPPRSDVVADAPKPDERAQVSSPLQSTPTQREGEVEAGIRADVRRATENLNRVDYRLLSADARDQYNGAKTLIQLAEEALRARNLVFAKSLAEKAGTLAAQLAGR